jgi:hypothetical protein
VHQYIYIYIYSFAVHVAFAHPFVNRAAVFAKLNLGMGIPYLQFQVTGLLTGKFTLHAQTSTIQTGATDTVSTMVYPSNSGLSFANAKESFTDVLKTFSGRLEFDGSKEVTPDLPHDWIGPPPIYITIGVPISIQVHVALVAELSATRDNQFTASVGAYARASSTAGLFVFSKMEKPCTGRNMWGAIANLPTEEYKDSCLAVFSEAYLDEDDAKECHPLSWASPGRNVPPNFRWSCPDQTFLVIQERRGPDVTTSFSAPTLTAKNNREIVFGVGFYPMYVDHISLPPLLPLLSPLFSLFFPPSPSNHILTFFPQRARINLCQHLQDIHSPARGSYYHG